MATARPAPCPLRTNSGWRSRSVAELESTSGAKVDGLQEAQQARRAREFERQRDNRRRYRHVRGSARRRTRGRGSGAGSEWAASATGSAHLCCHARAPCTAQRPLPLSAPARCAQRQIGWERFIARTLMGVGSSSSGRLFSVSGPSPGARTASSEQREDRRGGAICWSVWAERGVRTNGGHVQLGQRRRRWEADSDSLSSVLWDCARESR